MSKNFNPHNLPPLPSPFEESLLETAVQRQATEREREQLAKKLDGDPGVLIVPQRDYHHGQLGKMIRGGVYRIPDYFYRRMKLDYANDKKPPFKMVDDKAAAAQLAANKGAWEKRKKLIQDWMRARVGEDGSPQGANGEISESPLVS